MPFPAKNCHRNVVELQPIQTLFETINEPRLKTEPYVTCFLFFLSSKSTSKKSSLSDSHFTIDKYWFWDSDFGFYVVYTVILYFFLKKILLFGCPTANFGSLLRGQPHSPDVNHCVLHFSFEGHWEPCNKVWVPKPGRAPCGV